MPIPHPFITPFPTPLRHGFTLVEMAVVLVIIGLVMMTVFPTLSVMRISSQRAATQSNLHALLTATAAYAQAYGCLPCPTPASAVGNGFGHVRGDSSAIPAACGACTTAEGIPPYMALGVAASVARDGWGHWFSMRIDPALAVNFGVVPPTAPCTTADVTLGACTSAQVGFSQKGLCKSGLATTNRIKVTPTSGAAQPAAVLFVSHGTDGYGAPIASALSGSSNGCRLPFPTLTLACHQSLSCTTSSGLGAAQCNASGTVQFIDAAPGDGYDDMMIYADRNSLVSLFGSGSCQTTW